MFSRQPDVSCVLRTLGNEIKECRMLGVHKIFLKLTRFVGLFAPPLKKKKVH